MTVLAGGAVGVAALLVGAAALPLTAVEVEDLEAAVPIVVAVESSVASVIAPARAGLGGGGRESQSGDGAGGEQGGQYHLAKHRFSPRFSRVVPVYPLSERREGERPLAPRQRLSSGSHLRASRCVAHTAGPRNIRQACALSRPFTPP